MPFEIVPTPATDDGSTSGYVHITRPCGVGIFTVAGISMDDGGNRIGKGCFIQGCEVGKPHQVLRHADGTQADPAARV